MISQFAPTDIGPPHYWDKMPEISKKNYGQWQYHEYLQSGVMKHVGPEGALYTVRVGSPRPHSALSLLHSPTLTSIHDHRKNHSLD